jgi:hypothetical protein
MPEASRTFEANTVGHLAKLAVSGTSAVEPRPSETDRRGELVLALPHIQRLWVFGCSALGSCAASAAS